MWRDLTYNSFRVHSKEPFIQANDFGRIQQKLYKFPRQMQTQKFRNPEAS